MSADGEHDPNACEEGIDQSNHVKREVINSLLLAADERAECLGGKQDFIFDDMSHIHDLLEAIQLLLAWRQCYCSRGHNVEKRRDRSQ